MLLDGPFGKMMKKDIDLPLVFGGKDIHKKIEALSSSKNVSCGVAKDSTLSIRKETT